MVIKTCSRILIAMKGKTKFHIVSDFGVNYIVVCVGKNTALIGFFGDSKLRTYI